MSDKDLDELWKILRVSHDDIGDLNWRLLYAKGSSTPFDDKKKEPNV